MIQDLTKCKLSKLRMSKGKVFEIEEQVFETEKQVFETKSKVG